MGRSAAVTRRDTRTLSVQSPTDLWLYEANTKYDLNAERAFMCAEYRVFRFHSGFPYSESRSAFRNIHIL